MYNSTQDTLIIGKKVIYLPSCHSTNDIAAEIVHAGLFDEGTVVITDNQLKGRGQRGTEWRVNPGENLTFSLILKPDFLPIQDQFLISQAVALAVREYVSNYVQNAKVKWPNDILANGGKICGTLIENSIQGSKITSSLIGIGVNINQTNFESKRATSLSVETGKAYRLGEEFHKLLKLLDAFYLQLKSKTQQESLKTQYLHQLYGYGDKVKFIYEQEIVSGEVLHITPQGKIGVLLDGKNEPIDFGLKEIEWFRD